MALPQVNTKIERAVEAVESLTVAVVNAAHQGNRESFDNVKDARQELRVAFSEFITPTLRVVDKQ